ncbi:dentin sialophosphoprotein [Sabethes cyaneus]|uniref:dentin sialophosphoprotein n=1 Tax=Sabethes cyaneus TaxID=53552 RepID=UPI00237E18EA|nr:dentin sialophosphoprotein [Sabethes cyaneus]
MPRIDPLKLLVCLSVLLAPNGGIRSANEVKRLANLMAKFSKKLVSKCIYIQILKCTETELLGQFMAAGGWSLVHMWLADGITTKNWPLIQELLELLLCCPVDVERLKSNTAPKLVKSLSKDSSHEGVRLLASKLVEQWLKIARSDIRSGSLVPSSSGAQQTAQADGKQNASSSGPDVAGQEDLIEEGHEDDVDGSVVEEECDVPDAIPIDEQQQQGEQNGASGEVDTDDSEENVEETKKAFNSAVAESNAKKAPLLFKITVKNGKQVLAKVESPSKKNSSLVADNEGDKTKTDEEVNENGAKDGASEEVNSEEKPTGVEETDSKESIDKNDENKTKDEKKEKSESDKKDRRKSDEKDRSKDKERSSSKDKDKHREKDKDRKSSSSSSNHKSSSSKSSSSKHNSSTSSSSGKSKSSSSSSSKSSSSSSSSKDKDKDRHNSSTSSNSSSKSKHHHKSSSSSSSSKSSSSSSKSGSSSEKHRDPKDKSSHSSKDKDKESTPKATSPSSAKLPKIPRKLREDDGDKSDSSLNNKSSPVSSKKASISIEVRNAENRPKTVKTYNSQFRSHGLIEEAPPPPSRKGLKKPASVSSPSAVIGSTATGTIGGSKRSSPPPSSKDVPPEKKAREDPVERPGAIKLIPPKRQHSLVESDMFMDALSATLKKDVKKRKRKLSASESSKTAATDKSGANPATATTAEKASNATAASPDKIAPASPPPTSPVTEKQAPSTPTGKPVQSNSSDTTAPDTTTSNGSEPASSPAKVVAAPMSFYRDTLADSEENAEDKKESTEGDEKPSDISSMDVDVKSEETSGTSAEQAEDDDDEDLIKKPKRVKSELNNDDEDADDKLINAVDHDLEKKMAQAEGASLETQDSKKPPGPGCGPDGPPGVLVIHRRKGPKKQLKWKAQEELEEIRYFELDITERCNVTKTFTDLKHLERVDEREKYMLARKIHTDDVMIERTPWIPLITVDNVPPHPDGVNSQERRIQRDRERNVLQALYFNRHMIPDSPGEPDVEVYSVSTPAHIPLEDVTGNPDSVNDFTTMPWPEPKSTPPHESAGFNSPFFTGTNNDFPPFGGPGNWDIPGANPSPMPGMLPPGRIPPGISPMPVGAHNSNPMGGPNMMRQMSVPPSMPPNGPPNMPPAGLPHPNMFPNNPNMFPNNRGPPPMQHMNDMEDDNFRGGPPPPPSWFNNGNNRGPPGNFHHNHNRGGGGDGGRDGGRGGFGGGGGRSNQGSWMNNNRDNDRGGPRNSNYRPPWLQNRGSHNNHRGGGRKW